ncbi:hypothetical protein SynBOUM118_01488 [Synechococcus sp. BOUM118]|nr:hypothetical protein SynBOUM118_01488 [Synechococcus sp. BOUM118]
MSCFVFYRRCLLCKKISTVTDQVNDKNAKTADTDWRGQAL